MEVTLFYLMVGFYLGVFSACRLKLKFETIIWPFIKLCSWVKTALIGNKEKEKENAKTEEESGIEGRLR